MAQEIKVPDIGDFDEVEIIELLVAEGDTVEKEQPLITLESDKATLEVPSTAAGRITSLKVAEGDKVSEGDVIATVEAEDESGDDDGDEEPAGDTAEADKQSDEPRGADEPSEEADDSDGDEADDSGSGETVEVKVPDIGDFDSVEVIEVLVAEGDTVEKEQPLITLESDKATLEVPSTVAGTIRELKVKEGSTVSEGDLIALVASASGGGKPAKSESKSGGDSAKASSGSAPKSEPKATTPASDPKNDKHNYDCDVLVLGSGPGGYTAAFRAADMGLNVTLVERHSVLGGVCLNVGCIPSKALLHSAKVIEDAANMASHGVTFGKPEIDLAKLLDYKQSVIDQLTGGLKSMAAKRKVNVVNGTGTFADEHTLKIDGNDEVSQLTFNKAIIAVGSEPVMLPGWPEDERIWTSEEALSPDEIPGSLLVVGGGIIGCEIANVYAAHGTEVDVVEMTDSLIPGADKDLIKPLTKRMNKRCGNIWVSTKVTGLKANKKALKATFEGKDAPESKNYDRVLVAVGRKPNGHKIGAENAGLEVNERGFIPVDKQCRTNVAHIFAIGDVSGEPQLAHRATHQGKVAAECCAGEKAAFDAKCIPSVVYTDPEVAWTGVTETQAKKEGIEYTKSAFPWAANGRAIGLDATDGSTKLLFGADGRIIGAGAVGSGAGDLIAETCLAIEMGADAHDIGLTIHPHPTLAETVGMAAEAEAGTLTDLYIPKKKK
ncbi:dihydrolipoyl dehydrogenase [Salinisphaera sp. SWV1]|uniref:dihydrolipoyl dehydrogenase n=1 Tax=Salinisphaera sp. SWV1 TaxID=3454139 RepID=UPI003F82D46D